MKKLFILILLVSAPFLGQAQTAPASTILDNATFKDSISQKKVQLIDVRTPREYAQGHIDEAINIDFLNANFAEGFDQFDKSQPIYIYCKSGNRSGKAAKQLTELGFEKIYDLKGGYSQYK